MHMCMLRHVQLFANPWTIACQAPLSMEFSREQHWSGLFPPPGELSDPAIKSMSPARQVDFFLTLSHLQSPALKYGVHHALFL